MFIFVNWVVSVTGNWLEGLRIFLEPEEELHHSQNLALVLAWSSAGLTLTSKRLRVINDSFLLATAHIGTLHSTS